MTPRVVLTAGEIDAAADIAALLVTTVPFTRRRAILTWLAAVGRLTDWTYDTRSLTEQAP